MVSTGNSLHTNQEIFCPYDDCLKSFTSTTHLNRHEASCHINNTYKCDECDEFFHSQYAQKRHKDKIHLKKKPKKYKCEYCEEDFNKKSWLNRHNFKHTGVKPYACTFKNCDARFICPSKLKRHMKLHEGYTCPKENCNEKFSKWSEVRKHLKIRHPKVFKCPECEQEFSRSNNLKSHLVIHNSDREVFLCPIEGCQRFYSKKSNVMIHISDYHEKRPYHCTFGQCSKCFKSQEDLDAHTLKHSPSGRLRKKKKKNKPKPTLAEKLAGLAPKKWQIDLLNNSSKPTDTESSLATTSETPCIQNNSGSEVESIADSLDVMIIEQESSCVGENCDKMSSVTSDVERNNNDLTANDSDSDYCIENDDIQTLLNLVEKRSKLENPSVIKKTECISTKA